MNKRSSLLAKIMKAGFSKNEVFVSVAEFFDGNDDAGSIGCNIYPYPPSLKQFFETLSAIKALDKTHDLLVRIADIDDGEWFYTDAIYLFGEYDLEEVKQLFAVLKPDEVNEGLMYGMPGNYINQSDVKAYSIWWD
jgi:hypothetical protein